MKLGATDSIKFKKLKMKLGIPHWQAVGLLESIWMFTSRDAPLGDIGRHPDDDIAAAIEWTQDPTTLINVLVECRWLDRSEEYRLTVHDWADHMPNWLSGNLKKHGKEAVDNNSAKHSARQLAEQAAKQDTSESAKQPPERVLDQPAQAPSYSYQFNSSLTNSIDTNSSKELSHSKENSKENQEKEKQSNTSSMTPEEISFLARTNGGTYLTPPSESFHKWWQSLPDGMKSGHLDCWNYWPVAIQAIMTTHGLDFELSIDHLIRRTKMFAISDKGKSEEFRWSAKTFLEAGHYDDAPKSWERKVPGERKPKVQPLNGKTRS